MFYSVLLSKYQCYHDWGIIKMITVLFPSDYFDQNKPDVGFIKEYRAAAENQIHVLLFSYDEFLEDGKLRLKSDTSLTCPVIYRGWMLKPEKYAELYHKLQDMDLRLITSPREYKRMHSFPEIYPELTEDTAPMIVFEDPEKIDYEQIRKSFRKCMVKDYVKSVKGTDFPKCISTDIGEDEFRRLIKKFLSYRGELYTGGICIKEFLELKRYNEKTNEFRVFYCNNQAITIGRNSGQPECLPQPPEVMIKKYSSLKSPFYTVDYAETADGCWKIIEAGDGQVSGLSDFQDAFSFYGKLSLIF